MADPEHGGNGDHHEPKSQAPKRMIMTSPPSPESDYKSSGDSRRSVTAAIVAVILLIGFTALILYLIYHPHRPRFTVAGAAVYDLNATSPPLISTSLQFTVLVRNPNRRVSVDYDRLTMYASYRDQIITPPLDLPPLHQGTKSTVAMAPVLGGNAVPVSPQVAEGLRTDQAYGVVPIRVVVMGKLRWRGGAVRTGRYGLYVKCDVWIGVKNGSSGQVPLLGPSKCNVDV